jgi:RNA polymerase sigma-70 factor (ECF subfamily)
MNTDTKHQEVASKTKLAARVLLHSSSTSIIQAPVEQVNVSEWLFTSSDKEYQQCSVSHIARGSKRAALIRDNNDGAGHASSHRTALTRRFSSDERQEFESIALVHADALLRMARRLLRNDSLAEDAVQETLLSAWRAFHQFQRDTNCKAWLFRILLNGISKNGQRAVPLVGLPLGKSLDNIMAIRQPFESMAYSEAIAAIDALPEERRIVFLLAVEGFACKEIGSMLAIPIGTVMSRLSRCRAELRKALSHRLRPGDRESRA